MKGRKQKNEVLNGFRRKIGENCGFEKFHCLKKQVKNKKLSLKTTKYAVDKQVTLEIFSNGVLSLQMIGTYPGQISTFQRILSEIGPPPKN